MPSSIKAYRVIESMADQTDDTPLVDLGSGWGNLAIRLAKRYPQRQVYGYEVSWIPWAVSVCLKSLLRLDNLTLHRTDFLKSPWPEHATLLCYLFPSAMQQIAERIAEPGSSPRFVISNNFALPQHHAIRREQIRDFYRSPIYLYKIG
ncbi:hypothetical protein GCM10007876_38120 [Litoribrevibacter albus]|uniref:Class I SAM-dependent methyltransferase n=2 Tax=Litoribrevibacter albus TaxID=1473156 RepID=A0AA37SF16_9GAMM|nr:hypothetical protein GCM10007876_38120 [Litoribrevibacter albus]